MHTSAAEGKNYIYYHTPHRFSQFRPGVIVIGKTDGSLDIWDLLDQSHKYTIQYQVVACALTAIKFHETLPQIVAVGDIDGTLHLLEFPGTLCRKQGDEEKTMMEFWEREVKRVNYYTERFKMRDEQSKLEKQEKEKIEALELAKEAKHQEVNTIYIYCSFYQLKGKERRRIRRY
jgi:hypothetical protein